MGPVGSGKTSLVEHLAAITGRKGIAFKKVQLGDQTDSRMLLGSHQCTDVPGEFVWRAGVLTEVGIYVLGISAVRWADNIIKTLGRK